MVLKRLVQERRKLERCTPPYIGSRFPLSITYDDPRTVREEMNSEDGKL